MNLLEKTSWKGEWFLPQTQDKRYVGELTYDPGKGSILELHGNFIDSILFDDNTYDIVCGLIEGSHNVTLCDVFMCEGGKTRFVRGVETSVPTCKYFVNHFFINCKVEKKEDLLFNSATVHINRLEEWVGKSGFIFDNDSWNDSLKELHVKYRLPNAIEFKLPIEDFIGNFGFRINDFQTLAFNKAVTIRQITTFTIKSENCHFLEDFKKQILRFYYFMILGMYCGTYIDSYILTMPNEKQKIEYYFRQSDIYTKENNPKDYFFSFRSIENRFFEIINKWYSLCEEFGDVIWLLIDQFVDNSPFTSNKFLNVVQVAESFHSLLYNHTREDKTIYKEKIKDIVSYLPENYSKFVESKLIQGNELTMLERVNELIDKCPISFVDHFISNKDLFLKEIRDSRNYYTHYHSKDKNCILHDFELSKLSDLLKLVVVINIFMHIGFTNAELTDMIQAHRNKLENLIR